MNGEEANEQRKRKKGKEKEEMMNKITRKPG